MVLNMEPGMTSIFDARVKAEQMTCGDAWWHFELWPCLLFFKLHLPPPPLCFKKIMYYIVWCGLQVASLKCIVWLFCVLTIGILDSMFERKQKWKLEASLKRRAMRMKRHIWWRLIVSHKVSDTLWLTLSFFWKCLKWLSEKSHFQMSTIYSQEAYE